MLPNLKCRIYHGTIKIKISGDGLKYWFFKKCFPDDLNIQPMLRTTDLREKTTEVKCFPLLKFSFISDKQKYNIYILPTWDKSMLSLKE